jgi:cytosine/adenosine deaminase-related metal-dependent hydrolase
MATDPVSTLYTNGTIITVNETRDVVLDGAILVVGGLIAAIGKAEDLVKSQKLPAGTVTVNLKSKIVMPGLINAHSHLIQSLMRGLGEDMDLHRWACDAIWPLEASYEKGDGYTAAKLTMAEMLKSGTTCFLESMLPSQAQFGDVARAVEETGIRACLVSQTRIRQSR